MRSQDAEAESEPGIAREGPVNAVVGIGASAGGVEALQSFIPAIPTDSGLSFVIVQHLDPDHESVLTKLLGRLTRLPVQEVTQKPRSNRITSM